MLSSYNFSDILCPRIPVTDLVTIVKENDKRTHISYKDYGLSRWKEYSGNNNKQVNYKHNIDNSF